MFRIFICARSTFLLLLSLSFSGALFLPLSLIGFHGTFEQA
ncbi:MAG TPA: hypothetical protein VFX63_14865 [Pyrinomonadaceae bacterium]|nr:hypothetical protein [Pyrinomonadaceae bacterium]